MKMAPVRAMFRGGWRGSLQELLLPLEDQVADERDPRRVTATNPAAMRTPRRCQGRGAPRAWPQYADGHGCYAGRGKTMTPIEGTSSSAGRSRTPSTTRFVPARPDARLSPESLRVRTPPR
jgi:hypothetical protein